VRVAVDYNAKGKEAGLPPSLFVKGSFHGQNPYNDPAKPDLGTRWNNWAETQAYLDVIPLVDVEHAHCYVAHWHDTDNASFILMEDLALRVARFLDAFDTLNHAEAARFLDSMANMHAKFWDSPEFRQKGRFEGLAKRTQALKEMFEHSFLKVGAVAPEEQAKSGAGTLVSQDYLLPKVLHDKQRRLAAMQQMFAINDTFSKCVVMGDEHLRNLYITPDGVPGYVDWASRVEGWPLSVGYFMVNCLDPVDRRKWERPLLAHYLTRLRAYGASAPGFEDAWFGYRCAALFPFLAWVNNRAAWQPAKTNAGCTVRAATAVLDLDSYEAVGV
jgi:hypothetical protein